MENPSSPSTTPDSETFSELKLRYEQRNGGPPVGAVEMIVDEMVYLGIEAMKKAEE